MLRPGRQPLPCCPICSESRGNALKYHLKACARQTLAQLTACPHCCRPIRKDDLPEHKARCALQFQKRDSLHDKERALFRQQAEAYRSALAKIESGELANLDDRGLFVCSVCGQKGIPLHAIVEHEEQCRQMLARDGHVPKPVAVTSASRTDDGASEAATGAAEPEPRQEDGLVAMVESIATQIETSGGGGSAALSACLESLKEVADNACHREEKKFRKLRRSNAAFSAAIGRWSCAVDFLHSLGFESTEHTNKAGEVEEHLVMAEPLSEEMLAAALAALDRQPQAAAAAGVAGQAETGISEAPTHAAVEAAGAEGTTAPLMECIYCHRKFRFDRIAKHETRCPSAKPPPPKFDAVRHALQGTPGESAIPEVKRVLQQGYSLPPLRTKKGDGGEECPRCGRRFNPDSLVKHMKHCKAEGKVTAKPRPASSSGRPSSAKRPSTAASTTAAASSVNGETTASSEGANQCPPVAVTAGETSRAPSNGRPPSATKTPRPTSGNSRNRSTSRRTPTKEAAGTVPPPAPSSKGSATTATRPASATRRGPGAAVPRPGSAQRQAPPAARPPIDPRSQLPPQAQASPAAGQHGMAAASPAYNRAACEAPGGQDQELPHTTELLASSGRLPLDVTALPDDIATYSQHASAALGSERADEQPRYPPSDPRQQHTVAPTFPQVVAQPPLPAVPAPLPPAIPRKVAGGGAPTYEDLEVDVAEWLGQ